MKHSFCEDWEFTRHWTEAFGKGLPVPKQQAVRLPHTCREVPLHCASPADYEMVCGYRKRFRVPPVQTAPRLFLRFDGAAHQAVVRVNGRVAGQHRGGYTGFAVEITDLVDREGENLLTVQLDTREDPAIPPFGFVIDYLTYGGLYREVWLEATAESRLTDLFVYTPTLHDAVVQWTAELTPAAVAVRIRLETADGTLLAQQTAQAAETGKMQLSVPDAQPWDTEHPVLHHAVAELLNAAGQPIDRKQVTFGFRTAEFRADDFYLNGKKTFLRGLNRHQSYPYIGYAAPESLQREDARILQEELHCTAVRTSHYPQSPYFLDECDRRGLLVFTELPGWQHIGDDNWKDAACEMLQEMILQGFCIFFRRSLSFWGKVRYNERNTSAGVPKTGGGFYLPLGGCSDPVRSAGVLFCRAAAGHCDPAAAGYSRAGTAHAGGSEYSRAFCAVHPAGRRRKPGQSHSGIPGAERPVCTGGGCSLRSGPDADCGGFLERAGNRELSRKAAGKGEYYE